MDSAIGPQRSPHHARSKPYARSLAPSPLEAAATAAARPPKGGSGLLGSLMRKGLGWIVGVPAPASSTPDEEGAIDSQRGLARSQTMSSLPKTPRSLPLAPPPTTATAATATLSTPRHAPPSVPASLSARSESPGRPEARRRTAHSRLDLPHSASHGSLPTSYSYSALPSTSNGAAVFGESPNRLRADPYGLSPQQPPVSYVPAYGTPPPLAGLTLRSPSPGAFHRTSQQMYPHSSAATINRRRGPSPLNPTAPERSHAPSVAIPPRMAWSPSRGYSNGTHGSQAGSSAMGNVGRDDGHGGRMSGVSATPRVSQNEAERILDVLESMRTPLGSAGRPIHSTRKISVPVAVSSANNLDLGYAPSSRSVFISPYARRQQQELEQRQQARRHTLSEALRQRELDAEEQRRQRRRTAAQADMSPPPRQRKSAKSYSHDGPIGDGKVRRSKRQSARRRTKERSPEPESEEGDDDAMEEDVARQKHLSPPARNRAETPRLASPGRQRRARTPPPPAVASVAPPSTTPKLKSPAPLSHHLKEPSRASSKASSMRPGRTHTSRTHYSRRDEPDTSTITPDDDEPATDAEALRNTKMPKFSFPANFTFGSTLPSPSAPPILSTPALPPPSPASAATKGPALPVPDAKDTLQPVGQPRERSLSPQAPPSLFSRLADAPQLPQSPDLPPAVSSSLPPLQPIASAPAEKGNPFATFQGFGGSKAAEPEPVSNAAKPNPFAAFKGFGAASASASSEPSEPKKVEPIAPFSFGKTAEKPAADASPASAFSFAPVAPSPVVPPPVNDKNGVPNGDVDESMAADESRDIGEVQKDQGQAKSTSFFLPTTSISAASPSSAADTPSTNAVTTTAGAPAFGFPSVTSMPPPFSFGKVGNDATSGFIGFGKTAEPVTSAPASTAPTVNGTLPALQTKGESTAAVVTTESATPATSKSAHTFGFPTTKSQPAGQGFSFLKSTAPETTSGSAAPVPAFTFTKPAESPSFSFKPVDAAPAPSPFTFNKPSEVPAFSFAPASQAPSAAVMEASKSTGSQTFGSAPPSASGPTHAFGSTVASANVSPFSGTTSPNPFGGAPSGQGSHASLEAAPSNPFAAFQSASSATSTAFSSQPTPPAFGGFGSGPSSTAPQTSAFGFGVQSQQPQTSQPAAFGGFGTTDASSTPTFQFGAPSSATHPSSFNSAGPPAFGAQPTATPAFGLQPSSGASASPTFDFNAAQPAPQPTGSSNLFNIGSGGNESPSSPGGRRQIRPLPNRRGRR